MATPAKPDGTCCSAHVKRLKGKAKFTTPNSSINSRVFGLRIARSAGRVMAMMTSSASAPMAIRPAETVKGPYCSNATAMDINAPPQMKLTNNKSAQLWVVGVLGFAPVIWGNLPSYSGALAASL